jgi:hypothetical protein
LWNADLTHEREVLVPAFAQDEELTQVAFFGQLSNVPGATFADELGIAQAP